MNGESLNTPDTPCVFGAAAPVVLPMCLFAHLDADGVPGIGDRGEAGTVSLLRARETLIALRLNRPLEIIRICGKSARYVDVR